MASSLPRRHGRRRRLGQAAPYLILVVFSALVLVPYLWAVVSITQAHHRRVLHLWIRRAAAL